MRVSDVRRAALGLVRALGAGGLTAGLFVRAVLLVSAGASGTLDGVRSVLALAALVALVAGAIVGCALLVFALPVTLLLRRYDMEAEATYMVSGGAIGLLLPCVALLAADGEGAGLPIFGLLGAASGAMSGRTWWRRYRRSIVDPEDAAPTR